MIVATGRAVFIVGLCLAAFASGAYGQCERRYRYEIIVGPDCPFPFPPVGVTGAGINEDRVVVGHQGTCDAKGTTAFRWTAAEGLSYWEFPAGTWTSRAREVNDAGVITGWFNVENDAFSDLGFVWDGKTFTTVFPPAGSFCHTSQVNEKGQVAGTTDDGTNYFKSFIWTAGKMVIIEPTFGLRSSTGGLNDDGEVVGWMGTSNSIDAHGFLWKEGKVTDLGLVPGSFSTQALGLNSNGETVLVGWYESKEGGPPYTTRGFFYDDGRLTDIGTLPGFDSFTPAGITDDGLVGGSCTSIDNLGDVHPVLWEAGVMWSLREQLVGGEGVFLEHALGMNERGEIITGGTDTEANGVTFLLKPLVGDLNADGTVNPNDVAIILNEWGDCAVGDPCCSDLNRDGAVDPADLAILLGNWG